MNAHDFQTQATEWLAAVVVVGGLVIQAYFNLKHKWEIEQLKARQDRQGAAIKEQGATVTQVALAAGAAKPKDDETV